MKKPLTFEGLKVRPSYDELINLLDKPVDYKYPDRKASQLRNSHWLSQLDGDSYRAMDELHHNMIKEHEKEGILKGYAASHHLSLASLKAHHLAPPGPPSEYHSAAEFYTPPPSPRQATPTHYSISTPPPSPRQATPPVVPIIPSVQKHYISVPEAPNQSINRKVKKVSNKEGKNYRVGKFSKMTDTTVDDKIQEQHEMNVDDAEMQQAQAESKQQKLLQQYEDMMSDINLTKKKRQQAET